MSDKSFLEMTDEEFLASAELEETSLDAPSEEELSPEPVEPEELDDGESTTEVIIDENPEPDEELLDEEEDEDLDEETTGSEEEGEESLDEDEEDPEPDDTSSDEDDLKRILEPFRANGKDIQVKNTNEAITLMQLGANYTKKMQALQPNLKMLKTLEKNDLLSPDKLNYLIDLSKGDPKAIAKLVQSSEVNPLELEQDVEYNPTNHQVSDQVMQATEVLDDIESTPTGAKCIDLVANQWDESSREYLMRNPIFMRELNEQMSTGIYDTIRAEVERVRTFGGLAGLSNFDAYRQVGAQLANSGQLAQPAKAANTEPVKPVATTQVKQKDATRSKKRKAATTPKSARKTAATPPVNPLELSDEDFIKMHNLHI